MYSLVCIVTKNPYVPLCYFCESEMSPDRSRYWAKLMRDSMSSDHNASPYSAHLAQFG